MLAESIESGALLVEHHREYHAAAKRYMSSHRLSDIRLGRTRDEDDKPRPHYDIGRWTHTMILEGEGELFSEVVVGGPFNPKTRRPYGMTSKAFQEQARILRRELDLELVPPDQFALMCAMRQAVHRHEVARQLLDEGRAELVARCLYRGVWCQIRCDWLTPSGVLVDLKTCRDIGRFCDDALRFDYPHQLAFYRRVLCLATGYHPQDVYLIGVEKTLRPQVQVVRVNHELLAEAEAENEEVLDQLETDEGGFYRV